MLVNNMKNEKMDKLSEKVSIVFSDEFKFNSDTFWLAKFSMPKSKEKIVADLGCGCGGILLWWYANGFLGKSFAVDVQREACDLVMKSAKLSNLDEKIKVICDDIKTLRKIPKGSVDLVVCNPPYFTSGKVSSKIFRATARHEVSTSLKEFIKSASKLLKSTGRLCMCYRADKLCDMLNFMREENIEPKRLKFIGLDNNKPIKFFMVEGKKNSKPDLKCYFENLYCSS